MLHRLCPTTTAPHDVGGPEATLAGQTGPIIINVSSGGCRQLPLFDAEFASMTSALHVSCEFPAGNCGNVEGWALLAQVCDPHIPGGALACA